MHRHLHRVRSVALRWDTIRGLLLTAALVAGLLLVLSYESTAKFSVLEAKFADNSASGLAIVPASCPSSPSNPDYPHTDPGCTLCPDGTPVSADSQCPGSCTKTPYCDTATNTRYNVDGPSCSFVRDGPCVATPCSKEPYCDYQTNTRYLVNGMCQYVASGSCTTSCPKAPYCEASNNTFYNVNAASCTYVAGGTCYTSCTKSPYCDGASGTFYNVHVPSCSYVAGGRCTTSCTKTPYCSRTTNTHYNVNNSCQYVASGACAACPAGQVWNATALRCEGATCTAGFTWNSTTLQCERIDCPAGQRWNSATFSCEVDACPAGFRLIGGSCVTEDSLCRPRAYCGGPSGRTLYQSGPVSGGGGACWTTSQNCQWGCGAGACLSAPAPELITWRIAPTLVRAPGSVQVTWDVRNVESCTVTRNDGGESWTGLSGSGTRRAFDITRRTVFGLSCDGYEEQTFAATSIVVNIVPIFDEQ